MMVLLNCLPLSLDFAWWHQLPTDFYNFALSMKPNAREAGSVDNHAEMAGQATTAPMCRPRASEAHKPGSGNRAVVSEMGG